MNIIIVGGGPSGLICALKAKSENNSVTIIDKNSVMGKKITVTGNGHANFYNLNININKYNSHDKDILEELLNTNAKNEILPFLESIGIDYVNNNDLVYPMSNVAASVQQALILACKKRNIIFKNEEIVINIEKEKEKFHIQTNKDSYTCDKLVLATGGKSYPKFGSTGDTINLLKKYYVDYYIYMPALTSLKGDKKYGWDGARSHAKLKYYLNNKIIKEEEGEIQLTKDGISGICVYNLSSHIVRNMENNSVCVNINFMPFLKEDFRNWYLNKCKLLKDYSVIQTLECDINYKILLEIIPNLVNKRNDELSESDLKLLEKQLISYKFVPISHGDFETSQVSSGGITLKEINENYELRRVKNLFVIGESLDVDGICGGFNMGFAFISGYVCGNYINRG